MATYTCDKMRPIQDGHEHDYQFVDCAKDAARVFASRIARKQFGKRGCVHHVRLDCAAMNGRYGNYEAFIGVPAEGGGMSGHNIRLTVYIEPQAPAGRLGVWR